MRASLTAVCLVIPAIECDVRAGKINLPEFIVKCPAHCKETKQQVYGTTVYASISSICNAAIHSGVVTNAGGKVIVRKMAGQNIYKGSNSYGVRSLSLPKWRESFVVSVGKPKKGVIYPSTLDYVPSRPTYVKTGQKEAKTTALPTTTAPEPTTTTTPEPTTTTTTTPAPTTTVPPTPPTTKARAAVHKVRDAGSSHPYLASVAAASSSLRRPEAGSAIRRQPSSPVGPAFNRVQPAPPERTSTMSQANPDGSYGAPDSGYTWSETDTPEMTAPRSSDSEGNRKVPLDATHTRGFSIREQEPAPRAPEPMSQGDLNCKVDLAFLMDGSWSIGKRRFKIQKDFLAEVAQTINVGVAGPMMGIIQYGDDPVTEISLKSYSNSREVKSAVDKIVQKGGLSNPCDWLVNSPGCNPASGPMTAGIWRSLTWPWFLVDGWPTDKVDEASRLARESGHQHLLRHHRGTRRQRETNLVEANFVDKLVRSEEGGPASGEAGVCDTDRLVCSKTCLTQNDIAFVIDGSSSVGTGNFRTVLQFVANVTREFEISDTDTRYNNKNELLNAIKRVNYWSGGTSTGAAITYTAEQLFSKSKPNKRKIMIVITGRTLLR
ncbi:vitrin [Labrus bergylta]|uniref:vitrin n=1 Tax=Labrus bergylta TaxID=56723 RepID=UPI0033134A35